MHLIDLVIVGVMRYIVEKPVVSVLIGDSDIWNMSVNSVMDSTSACVLSVSQIIAAHVLPGVF